MLEFLPKEVRDGLDAARKRDRAASRACASSWARRCFRCCACGTTALRWTLTGRPRLRGLVDVYDGSRHICQCLIVASTVENGELICDFKRSTLAEDRPALDFWRDENAPVGYLQD